MNEEMPEVRYSAFVTQGRLCVLGLANTSCGPVPLASYADISGDAEDGPIGEEPAANVKKALDEALEPMQVKLASATMQAGAESLVLRARAGDQNAMAILALIGEQAREGNEKAKKAASLVVAYCKSHPEVPLNIGSDEGDVAHPILIKIVEHRTPAYAYPIALATYITQAPPDMRTVVCLANGPHLTHDRLIEVASRLPSDEDSTTFLSGVQYANNPKNLFTLKETCDEETLRAGTMCAQARAIQRFRVNGDIEKFCADSAWEVGEGRTS